MKTAEEIPDLFEKAFALATGGCPGPVLVDVPMDIQRIGISVSLFGAVVPPSTAAPPLDGSLWTRLAKQMRSAQRLLLLVGGGIRSDRTADLLREFASQARMPVVHSLMGVDALPWAHPSRVGMIGSYGNRWANWAVGMSDLLLVLGSRLDVRQTGSETKAFKGERTIFHVDCDASEINNRVTDCTAVLSSLKDFLSAALKRLPGFGLVERTEWAAQIAAQRAEGPDVREVLDAPGINPNAFMHALSRVSAAACAYVVDVGQHQMWAAQCNIQELQTVARNQLPLKIVVINNHCHGMVRQFQQSYFDSRYQSTLWGYSAPDFAKVATAYGITGRRIAAAGEVKEALGWLWSEPRRPMLLEVVIDSLVNVYPKMAFGRPITEMETFSMPK